jgi:hypothetical protein
MIRIVLILTLSVGTLVGARTLVTDLPDINGDGAKEKAFAIEWPEPPALVTAERRLTITTEVAGVAYEPYVVDFVNMNVAKPDTVQTFSAKVLTPDTVVIYVVYRRMHGASAGWEDVALMLAPRNGRLEPVWEEVVANWSELHGGFDIEVSFDDLNGDDVPEIITWGVGTFEVGEDDEGEKIYEDYSIDKRVYYYDSEAGVYAPG